jgi:hypothetical protein
MHEGFHAVVFEMGAKRIALLRPDDVILINVVERFSREMGEI